MEIAVLVFLFLVGSIAGAMQAMKYLERRAKPRNTTNGSARPEPPQKPD